MKRITMGAEVLITDERIADLVLAYANVLARSRTSDTVNIPVVSESGAVQDAQLLVGPASQIVVTEDGSGGPTIDVEPALHDLQQRIDSYDAQAADEQIEADPDAYFVKFDDYER